MKPKAELMARHRKERAEKAKRIGLVKLRIELYVTPERKQSIKDYVQSTMKHGA